MKIKITIFDSLTNGIKGKIANRTANYGQQRFCFDNKDNRIYVPRNAPNYKCDGITDGVNMCLDDVGAGFRIGDGIGLWSCGSNNSQKWFFDEQGRIASLSRPDLCVYSYNTSYNTNFILYSCTSTINEQFRAGYNNFGTGMGMTIWSIKGSNNDNISGINGGGHSFVELWNNYGTHNTFSRWGNPSDYKNDDCKNQYQTVSQINNDIRYLRSNNICDKDQISVDYYYERFDVLSGYIRNSYRNTWSGLSKSDWDYIVFGSGYRSNYKYNGQFMDLGGDGTYNYSTSMSRFNGYNAIWNYGGNMCSTYSLKLWRNFRDYNSTGNLDNQAIVVTPTNIYDRLQ